MYLYIANLPRNVINRLSHVWSGECQDQGTFLEPSSDQPKCNYDTQPSNHDLPQLP